MAARTSAVVAAAARETAALNGDRSAVDTGVLMVAGVMSWGPNERVGRAGVGKGLAKGAGKGTSQQQSHAAVLSSLRVTAHSNRVVLCQWSVATAAPPRAVPSASTPQTAAAAV